MNRKHFQTPYSVGNLPAWRCAHCQDGALSLVKDSYQAQESAESRDAHAHEAWEPEWIRKRFSMTLRCGHCSDHVHVVGDVHAMEDHDDEHGWVLVDGLYPAFFHPATPIIRIPKSCPEGVADEIRGASALFWSSPSSAGNRIRVAVELLMDDRKIPRRVKGKNGKYGELKLHARIQRYEKKNPEVGRSLLAIKWLGNSASHNGIDAEAILDAFELLTYALDEIYDAKTKRLKKMMTGIIKKKGPVK